MAKDFSFPFYGYLNPLNATQKAKKSKEGFEVEPENRTRDLPHRSPRTNQLRQSVLLKGLKTEGLTPQLATANRNMSMNPDLKLIFSLLAKEANSLWWLFIVFKGFLIEAGFF